MTTTPNEPVRDEDIETVGGPDGPSQMGLGDADGTDAGDAQGKDRDPSDLTGGKLLGGDADGTDGGDADGTDGGDADGTDSGDGDSSDTTDGDSSDGGDADGTDA